MEPLAEVSAEFNNWINNVKKDLGAKSVRIWGNGMLADNRWLLSAYKAVGLKPAWKYNEDNDVRTIVDLGRRLLDIDPKTDMEFVGDKHNALDDCIHQIKYVCNIAKAFMPVYDHIEVQEDGMQVLNLGKKNSDSGGY
jgi:exodeoxyribonuclease VIII